MLLRISRQLLRALEERSHNDRQTSTASYCVTEVGKGVSKLSLRMLYVLTEVLHILLSCTRRA